MAAQTSFINSLLDAAFRGQTHTGGTITMKLFTGNLPSLGGTEVTGGSYAAQTVTFTAADAKTITSDGEVTFTDLPTSTIVAYGIYDDGSLIDEGLINPSFTADVTNNTLGITYEFSLDA